MLWGWEAETNFLLYIYSPIGPISGDRETVFRIGSLTQQQREPNCSGVIRVCSSASSGVLLASVPYSINSSDDRPHIAHFIQHSCPFRGTDDRCHRCLRLYTLQVRDGSARRGSWNRRRRECEWKGNKDLPQLDNRVELMPKVNSKPFLECHLKFTSVSKEAEQIQRTDPRTWSQGAVVAYRPCSLAARNFQLWQSKSAATARLNVCFLTLCYQSLPIDSHSQ